MPLPTHTPALQYAIRHECAALWPLLKVAPHSVHQKRKEVEYNHA